MGTSRGIKAGLAAAILVAVGVVAVGMQTGSAGPPKSSRSTPKGVPAVATDGRDRSSSGGVVNTMAVQQFPEVYAGVRSSNDPNGVTVVYVARGHDDRTFLAALDTLKSVAGPGNDCTIVSVEHSYADLQRMTLKIAADGPNLQKAGVHLAAWGPNYDLNKVEITLLHHYDTAAAAVLTGKYGNDWVTVSTTPQSTLPHAQ